jgi:hypothetical protein
MDLEKSMRTFLTGLSHGPRVIWRYLELYNSTWSYMEIYISRRRNITPPGVIWSYISPGGKSIGPTWRNLENRECVS